MSKRTEIPKIDFEYLLQPPKRYTFEQPKVKEWVEKMCFGKVLNLFSGKVKLAIDETRNDIDASMPAEYHQDAYELCNNLPDKCFDTIILDPPYSLRKSREKYGGRYIGKFTKIKNILPRILKDNGRVITFGYDSVGMSKSRGFTKVAILLICHSGDHDDTVVVVENKDLIGLVEEKEQALAKAGEG